MNRTRECSVDGCGRKHVARGWCSTHYKRWQDTGDANPVVPINATPTCQHPGGCSNPRRAHGYCAMHLKRWRQTGDLGPAGPMKQTPERRCGFDECLARHYAKGFCYVHYMRFRTHGDPSVLDYSTDHQSAGPDSPKWVGDDARYHAAHRRLNRSRGPASDQMCHDGCGRWAAHWSYDHADVEERIDAATGLVYSVDPERYVPRCPSCHWRFDFGHRRRAA